MSGINKIILAGYVGTDPDLKKPDDDIAVLSFPLATSEIIGKGEHRSEHTEWHTIVMWRGLAENAARLLKKGIFVYIEGKARTRSYDKDGIKRYTTEIVADQYRILGRKSDFTEDAR